MKSYRALLGEGFNLNGTLPQPLKHSLSMFLTAVLLAVLLTAISTLIGCGHKGELILPQPSDQEKTTDNK